METGSGSPRIWKQASTSLTCHARNFGFSFESIAHLEELER